MQRTARDPSSVPVDWNPENMGKAYVWSDVWTYIKSWRHASFITREERVSKPEYCRPTQRGIPACVVQTQRTRVPWSPRTAVGRVDYTLFGWR
jgi:hypothetical protein